MPELSAPVSAPAPKAAAPAVAPVTAPVAPPAAAPVTPPAPAAEVAKPVTPPAKPAKPMRESMQEAIARRVNEENAKQKSARAAAGPDNKKKVEEPAAPAKPAEAAKPADPTKPVLPVKKDAKDPDDSDAAIKAEIEVKTKGMDGAAKQAFADLRYSERDLRRQLKDASPKAAKSGALETELAAVKVQLDLLKKSTPASVTEVQELKEKLEKATARDTEREQELMAAKVEKTDAFKNAVSKPLATIDALAKKLAKKYDGVSEATLTAALHDTSDKQSDMLLAAVDGMNEIEKNQIFAAAVKIGDINEKAEVLRSQAAEALAKIEAKSAGETEKETAATKKARSDAHEANWKELKETIPNVLTPAEGDDAVTVAWNEAQTSAETFSKDTDYAALAPAVQSQLMQRAAVFPLLVGAVTSFETQLADEKAAHATDLAELNKFRAKVPGGGADRSADGAADAAADGKKGFVERTSARFAALGY